MGQEVLLDRPREVTDVSRLAALLVLTGAFAPAAVMGAMPVVAPVVIVCLALVLAVSAFEPPEAEAVASEPPSARAPLP